MKRLVIVLAAGVAIALPANASAARLHGVVVGKQKAQHVLVVAARDGTAWSVNTRSAARVGAVVTVSAKRLPNGTFAATRVRASGHASRAQIRGVVIRNVAGTTFFSAGRSIISVRSKARSLMSAAGSGPQPGTLAQVGVTIGQGGSLTATSINSVGQSNNVVIQATVASITAATSTTPGSVTLTVNGQQLVIPLPAGTVLPPTFVPGSTVMLTIAFGPSGPVGTSHDDDDTDDTDDDTDDTDDTDGEDDTKDDTDDD
jgi:hypothetical protein